MRWPPAARESALGLATALVVLACLSIFGGSPLLREMENATLDIRFRVRGPLAPSPDVAVILADDRSLTALGRWPFSRRRFISAIDQAEAAGAKLILFDLLFTEPENIVPPEVRALAAKAADLAAPSDDTMANRLRAIATDDPDADFTAAIHRAGNVLLPFAFGFGTPASQAPAWLPDAAFESFARSMAHYDFPLQPTSALLPLDTFARAALGLGHVNVAYDRSGAVRYDYAALPFDADFYPSLAIRAAASYRGVPWPAVALSLGKGVQIGPDFLPTDAAMRFVINFRGPRGAIPTYSFVDLLTGRLPAGALRHRIVLIGASFVGNADSFIAPFDSTPMPGTERMGHAIETILLHDWLIENPPGWTALMLAGAVLAAVVTGLAAGLASLRVTVAVAAAGGAGVLAAAQAAFDRGLWLPVVPPAAILLIAAATVLAYRFWFVDRQRRRVRVAFAHYMAPDMVKILAAHPERLKLGGQTRSMTLLFCDIRGFTTISESFKANPQGLTQLINRFLTPMTDVIMARRGTIDKYMGDCIMAFWNAPLDDAAHADHACASALAMRAELARLNERFLVEDARADQRPLQLGIGIGINSGDCVVGNMGSERRFDYSVLGDAVNLASRLEGQSKLYGVTIVIGEATRALAPGWAALELDLIAVKGKHDAVRIFTLLGDASIAASAAFIALHDLHNGMLASYRGQRWHDAQAAIVRCRPFDPALSALYDLYEQRIEACLTDPPGPEWNAVHVAQSK